MRTAYKCRAYPTSDQAAVLSRTFGCVRLVWNKTLGERIHRYRNENVRTSYRRTDATLTEWKRGDELAFLSEVSCVPLQQTLRHQHTAFQNFFSGRSRHPRFKSRKCRQSAHYTRSAFRMRGGSLVLAKMTTPLQFTWSFGDVDVTELAPTMVVVSREPDGRWYVSFAVESARTTPAPVANHAIGVDLGLTNFLVTSDGVRVANPRLLTRKARNLARYQRRLARCRAGSNNRLKAKAKVARAHRKIRNARQDFLHRTSTRLVRSADVIAIEDLNVRGMMRNRRLSHAIGDAGWGEFRRQLEYKCQRAGRTLVVVDRWFPSSKTCSQCGHLLAEMKLSARHWTCPGCRARHDRDLNAAKNILAAGRAVTRDVSGDACGADVRRQGTPLPQSAAKQGPDAVRLGA
ncbi:RNA-guided endonuclease TnpB family protein [Lentzea sp. NBRC 102530]|uniref:RNA-guided endonuclease InsQ/TnpB family protein n=1 Tax=Lentzea sp. NBRC 102530 TaxID=3032201 RepID=UPI0024A3A5BD|nr:RNA-guided endonuclease TnpB family protein [Lentzea sp. NBRC 102530]GLY51956.1 transposase [Lentzea sp. NBRC 102530]